MLLKSTQYMVLSIVDNLLILRKSSAHFITSFVSAVITDFIRGTQNSFIKRSVALRSLKAKI